MDISGLSGLDSPNDGRSAVIWDYDRDGWQDVAIVNSNAPLFEMWRNRMGSSSIGSNGQVFAIQLVGSNQTSHAQEGRSSRDAYGARILVQIGETVVMREHHAGEGLGAQNSSTLLIGLGNARRIDGLEIQWPSGKVTTEFPRIEAGMLVRVFEDPAQSPTGEGYVIGKYGGLDPDSHGCVPVALDPGTMLKLAEKYDGPVDSKLVMYTTMATWCGSCRRELPDIERLAAAFTSAELAIYGAPVDVDDDEAGLLEWGRKHKPAYRLLAAITASEQEHVTAILEAAPSALGLPATILTDARGKVLLVRLGPPTVSEIRRLLE